MAKKGTIRALYETRAQAERAREELAAKGFHEVQILAADQDGDGDSLLDKLERLMGLEPAKSWRSDLNLGKVVLVAKVEAPLQTEAAEIISAASLEQIHHEHDGEAPGV